MTCWCARSPDWTTRTGRSRSCPCGSRRSTAADPTDLREYAITTTDHAHGTAESAGAWLSRLIGELLGIDEALPTDRPLGELGIDSLTAAQLSVEVEERTGATVALDRFLGDETLDDLVRALGADADPAAPGAAA
ncbi:acyl carrier protein [Streptomyces formicae]